MKRTWYIVLVSLAMFGCCRKGKDFQELRIAYVMAPGGTSHEAANKIKELVESNTDGKIHVRLYPNGALGNDRILTEGLLLGSQDLIITGTALVGWWAPEYGLIEAPFLFRDYEHLNKVLQGDVGKEIEQRIYEKCGLLFLGYLHRGPRYLTTTDRKIQTPDDLLGLKLRVPELPTYIKSWKMFGANPSPIPYSDMYMALKQGVVDGQENPLEVIYTSHLYEAQSYIMNTRHLIGFYVIAAGERFFSKFSEQHQQIISEAITEAVVYHNGIVESYELEYIRKLKEHGARFVDVNRHSFEKLAREKLPLEFSDTWKSGVFDRIVSIE